jgi:hypothetical protein
MPSEVVTLGLLHALKGGGNRAFYRWLTCDYRPLFPRLPERTRLFRLFRVLPIRLLAFSSQPPACPAARNRSIGFVRSYDLLDLCDEAQKFCRKSSGFRHSSRAPLTTPSKPAIVCSTNPVGLLRHTETS